MYLVHPVLGVPLERIMRVEPLQVVQPALMAHILLQVPTHARHAHSLLEL